MSEYSGFFDAHIVDGEYDRVYLAEHFAKYFASFIGNGVFGGRLSELIVRQNDSANMSVNVLAGQGFINGYFYENTDEASLPIDNADGVLNRIDLVVLRLDKAERAIHLVVKRGVAASSPSAPGLERSNDFYELGLARIYVKAGATSITQANITDTRFDPEVCGLVVAVVDHLDTSEFNRQFMAVIDELEAVIGESDVASLIYRLNQLEEAIVDAGTTLESDDYPGCFYRIAADGGIEWLNPPAEPGIEYRLAERFENKPVYQILVPVLSLPNASMLLVTPNVMYSKVVSVQGVVFDSDSPYTGVYPFPVFMSSSAAPDAIIVNTMPGVSWTNVAILTTQDMTRYKADIILKYVK